MSKKTAMIGWVLALVYLVYKFNGFDVTINLPDIDLTVITPKLILGNLAALTLWLLSETGMIAIYGIGVGLVGMFIDQFNENGTGFIDNMVFVIYLTTALMIAPFVIGMGLLLVGTLALFFIFPFVA